MMRRMGSVSLEKFANLFGTIAQISFGITGLLFVALTIDEQRIKRWFAKKNVTFAALSFLMVVLPGFISLVGLIPDITSKDLSIFASIFYGITLMLWWIKNRIVTIDTRAERSKWKWLQKIWDIRGDSIAIFFGWLCSLFVPQASAFPIIGILLVSSVFLSILSIFSLFRNS
jgi:hypothetical protein